MAEKSPIGGSMDFGAKIKLLPLSLLLTACTTVRGPSPVGYMYDSNYIEKGNRAPASMSPPLAAGSGDEKIDPLYLRTQADYHFSMGEALSYEGQSEKAIESFKLVMVYDPNSAHVPLRLAAEYVKLGMLSEALEFAELSAQKDPNFVEARLLLGGLYSTLKDYDQAINAYQTALQFDPQNTEAPLYLSAIYAEMGNYELATKSLKRLLENEEYETPYLVHYYLGRVYAEQKEPASKAAEKSFKKALEIKPSHIESIMALTALYLRDGQSDKAIQVMTNYQRDHGPNLRVAEWLAQRYLEEEKYEEALAQYEFLEAAGADDLNLKVRMALIFIEQKQFERAVVKLRDILKIVPESDKIRFYLAAVYEETKEFDQAIEQFKLIPVQSQFYGEAMLHAAYLLKQIGQKEEALSLVTASLQKRKDVPQLYALYASLLDEKGDFKKAAGILEDASSRFPDHVQLKFFLGTIHDRLGNKDIVETQMSKVIELDPNHVQGLNYLAFTWAEANKNLDEAEKLVRRALELEPNDGYILDTLGWVLYKKGSFKDAVRVLEKAYAAQPNEAVIADHLGDAYRRLHLVEKAKRMYLKAAEIEIDETKAREIRAKVTALENQKQHSQAERAPASLTGVKEP